MPFWKKNYLCLIPDKNLTRNVDFEHENKHVEDLQVFNTRQKVTRNVDFKHENKCKHTEGLQMFTGNTRQKYNKKCLFQTWPWLNTMLHHYQPVPTQTQNFIPCWLILIQLTKKGFYNIICIVYSQMCWSVQLDLSAPAPIHPHVY